MYSLSAKTLKNSPLNTPLAHAIKHAPLIEHNSKVLALELLHAQGSLKSTFIWCATIQLNTIDMADVVLSII